MSTVKGWKQFALFAKDEMRRLTRTRRQRIDARLREAAKKEKSER